MKNRQLYDLALAVKAQCCQGDMDPADAANVIGRLIDAVQDLEGAAPEAGETALRAALEVADRALAEIAAIKGAWRDPDCDGGFSDGLQHCYDIISRILNEHCAARAALADAAPAGDGWTRTEDDWPKPKVRVLVRDGDGLMTLAEYYRGHWLFFDGKSVPASAFDWWHVLPAPPIEAKEVVA